MCPQYCNCRYVILFIRLLYIVPSWFDVEDVVINFYVQGHSSFVTHLDWSSDSVHLCSNSGDYEVLYCKCLIIVMSVYHYLFAAHWLESRWQSVLIFLSGKVPACKQETSISAVRDTEWASGNCTLTFNAAGI